MSMKNLSIRIPDELLEALKRLAEEQRRSLNSQIVYVLEQFVREEEKKSDG